MIRAAVAAFVSLAIAYGMVRCPADDSVMWATGRVNVSSYGKLLQEYRCPMGHTAWTSGGP